MIHVRIADNKVVQARNCADRPDGWLTVVMGTAGANQISAAAGMGFREIVRAVVSHGALSPAPVVTPPEPTQEEIDALAEIALQQTRAAMVLSFSQLLTGLVAETWITEAEGEAWASGNGLPAVALGLIASLPSTQQFAAKARLLRMSQAERLDPLVNALATIEGKTDAEIDAFFQTYSAV